MRLYQSKGLALALLLLLLCLLYWPGGQGGQAGRRQEQDRRLQEEQQEGGAITMAPSNFDPGSASFYQAGGAGSASSAQDLDLGQEIQGGSETVEDVHLLTETNSVEDEAETAEFLAVNKLRVATVEEQCRQFRANSSSGYRRLVARTMQARSPRAKAFTVVPRKSLAWCRTPKVATTTWARIVLQMFGVKKFGHYHSQMKRTEGRFVTYWSKKRYINSLANRQRKFRGLLLARHPIDRLFSAFRDKILRKSIIVKNLNKGSRTPTFRQFLTHLSMNSPATYDRHWKPNWLMCNPCKLHYDFIIKMETFSRDSGAVLRQVGAADLAGVNHLNGRGNPARPGLNYGHLLASVPAHILAKILDIFHLDFVLFGYDKGPLLELLSQKNEELLNKTVLR